jgi:hypothetical protein
VPWEVMRLLLLPIVRPVLLWRTPDRDFANPKDDCARML